MRLKLFLAFTVIVIISVALVAVIARLGAVNEVRTFMFRGGMYGVSDLASSLESYYQQHGSWDGVQGVLDAPRNGLRGMGAMMAQRVLVANEAGMVVADTQGVAIGNQFSAAEVSTSVPLSVKGQTVGYLLALGGMDSTVSNEQAVLGRLNRGVFLAGVIAGVLALIISLVLSYTLLRPVHELTFAAQQLANGDLSHRVEVHGTDELATLGHTFNQMADSLQQAEEARRSMTADIAHELRTPLAVQRANLEALQDGVYPLTSENLAPVIEQNHLLTRLVEDLRTLALADAGQIQLERTPTDLTALVEQVVERFQPQAATQQVKLLTTLPANPLPMVQLDTTRLEQILTNLLSNALRYTPINGQIEVTITRTPKMAVVNIHDSGQGIPQEALPYIFGRFYRVDKSRTRLEGGSGLGLAIARQLARAHEGDLTVSNHPGGGAVFTLILPL